MLHENFTLLNFAAVNNQKQIIMRKVILLFSAVFFALSAVAEDTTGVFMDIYLSGEGGFNTEVNRSLVQVPSMEVVYDAEAKTIRIASSEPAEADVYIYDANGAVVGHADTLNTIIQLPSSDSYTIYIAVSYTHLTLPTMAVV